ncbi:MULTISPECIES: 5-formyltetrahydrofolate cyclo-ligase [Micromonospora]|uniref:5-formyltetrahydrofolate cyclo-ligase n=1 Tax=Micromonospora solifontis TaxID=2487138 RepID=A0ABX9W8R8_9ACTN|nr:MULTISPECIES: 5-formyltetrahydrofolate cyclo-ligase [Micromonospora]NES14196.1 5-formyltetrahydrofolate cyclo-ligase [Micromonospora sp. PPF5-17B]NES39585.1 5-formyltetrahydrofolate cyclo-ligase [Micromonospora solifontis]NES55855.1 5-formyltetrahydrofolate cyclo-ligase [Micromonospora sp. PPF5-6]RNL88038.1 5-formyltetrahydrofolate cyclo-ligase [Micromonospora solifontis]
MPEFSDGADVTHEAKRELRVARLAHRRSLTAARRAEAAARVQAELISLVRRLDPARVTAYVPVGSEPGGADLPDVLRAALAPGAELLLPVLREDLDLDWAVYTGPGSLWAAGRGVREPLGPRLGSTAVATAGLVVVPALAVDRRGFRLGRGGGSYDRALARVPAGTPTVALLHDGELVEAVPGEPHDRPVHAVITPAGGLVKVWDGPLPLDEPGSDDAPLALG